MFRSGRRPLPIAAVVVALLAVSAQAAAVPRASEVRLGAYPNKTRFVLELSAPVAFRTFLLGDPYRVVIDLPQVEWKLDPLKIPKGGLITGLRYGQFTDTVSRVVLDASRPVEIAKAFLIGPSAGHAHRLVVDLKPTTAEAFARARYRPTAAADDDGTAQPVPVPRPKRGERPVVAIDAGHGGVDPGTTGVRGTLEKDVTLSHALALAARLRASGHYRVMLTRSRDIFIPLRKRVALARHAGADLFVSLHADANPNPLVSGASVYTLSERASDSEAAALAAKENKADVIAGMDLSDQSSEVATILIDLAQRETMNASARFAEEITDELGKVKVLLRRTHRFAGFAVLKAPDIPSVLIELGYLSNRREERRLTSPRERARTVAALARAIDAFFAQQQAFKR